MTKRFLDVTGSAALAIGLGGALFLAPSSANAGFFEQLFGIQSPPPSYGYARPDESIAPAPRYRVYRPKKHVEASAKPKRQMPTDLMHDATLRAGDAVMMKDGMHIYQGDDRLRHDTQDFVALDAASDISKKTRAELVALDTTRSDPLRSGSVMPDTIASGRSAAVGAPINPGYRITDARGKSMRYVGP